MFQDDTLYKFTYLYSLGLCHFVRSVPCTERTNVPERSTHTHCRYFRARKASGWKRLTSRRTTAPGKTPPLNWNDNLRNAYPSRIYGVRRRSENFFRL